MSDSVCKVKWSEFYIFAADETSSALQLFIWELPNQEWATCSTEREDQIATQADNY